MFTESHRLVSGDFFVKKYYLLQCGHSDFVLSDCETVQEFPHLQLSHVQVPVSQQAHHSLHVQLVQTQLVHQHWGAVFMIVGN